MVLCMVWCHVQGTGLCTAICKCRILYVCKACCSAKCNVPDYALQHGESDHSGCHSPACCEICEAHVQGAVHVGCGVKCSAQDYALQHSLAGFCTYLACMVRRTDGCCCQSGGAEGVRADSSAELPGAGGRRRQ